MQISAGFISDYVPPVGVKEAASTQAFHTEGPDLADRCLEMVRKEATGAMPCFSVLARSVSCNFAAGGEMQLPTRGGGLSSRKTNEPVTCALDLSDWSSFDIHQLKEL